MHVNLMLHIVTEFRKSHELKAHQKTKKCSEGLSSPIKFLEGLKGQVCDTCGKSFAQVTNLRKHIRQIHLGEKLFCDKCLRPFSQASNLKTHINTVHNGQKNHTCDSCGKSFSQATNLKTHIKKAHNGEGMNRFRS